MRVVHLITSLQGGGTENFLYQMLEQAPTRHEQRVFFLFKDGIIGDRIRRLGFSVEPSSPWRLYYYLSRKKPDVLHTCLHWAGQVGRVIGHRTHIPYIVSSHRSIDIWQKPWHRMSDHTTLPFCHTVIVNSDAAARVVDQRLKGLTTRPTIERIYNGLNRPLFASLNRRRARQALGLPEEAWVGGTLMRLHQEKGAEKIPAFAATLLNDFPSLHLIVAGSGAMQESLKEQTASLRGRLHWVGWQENAPEFLAALDFFWLLSREESFSQALLEASGAGLPWIAPDVGGVQELNASGAAGIVYSPNSTEAAIKAVRQLHQSQREWTEKAKLAAPVILEKYDLKRTAESFYRILESRGTSHAA